jgi:hypothetical protein
LLLSLSLGFLGLHSREERRRDVIEVDVGEVAAPAHILAVDDLRLYNRALVPEPAVTALLVNLDLGDGKAHSPQIILCAKTRSS